MYITITDIKGEKRMDVSYWIKNFDSSKEVDVVSLFSDNIQYKFMKPWTIELYSRSKPVMAGTIYARRELIDLLEGKIEVTQFDKDARIKITNKLEGITEVVLTLRELDNTNSIEDGKLGNALFTYHMTEYKEFTLFEPTPLSIRNLRTASSFL